jgi:hypothetical protein
MAKARRPAPKKKQANKRIVNPSRLVARIVSPRPKRGAPPIPVYLVAMVCGPETCPKCRTFPVYADSYGTYRCPHCPNTWRCTSCD